MKTASDGRQALEKVSQFLPDLVILDIMLPHMDGIETARRMREIPELQSCYILFLTARTEEYSQVAAFEIGGDDYVTKPIKPRAFLSRISALLNRGLLTDTSGEKLVIGDLTIDQQSYRVISKGQELLFPKKEFKLLLFLAQHPSQVFTRDELLKTIWGSDVYVLSRTVDVHIRKIREKIGEGYIKTLKGVGYKFELEE